MLTAVARLVAGGAMAGLVSILLVAPAAAADDDVAVTSHFVRLLNDARATAGLAPLEQDGRLDAVARDWSGVMATEHRLFHRPDLAGTIDTRVTTGWTRVGENVGAGESILTLHRAFLASPSHYANVVGDYNWLGVGVVSQGDDIWVTFNFMKVPVSAAPASLLVVAEDGGVSTLGGVRGAGSLRGTPLSQPIVGAALTTTGDGYWMVAADGGIFAFGAATFHGSTGDIALNQPIVGMATTPTGNGYWLVARDGGIFSFGDARFQGSTGHLDLNQPIAGMAPTPTGNGYWLVASDGGIFSFGDATFHGSTAGSGAAAPVVGIVTTRSGQGYSIALADGVVFGFGDGGRLLRITAAAPVVAIAGV
jgi:hypothetical protein